MYLSEYDFVNWICDGDVDDSGAPTANKLLEVIGAKSQERLQRDLSRRDITHISQIFRGILGYIEEYSDI